MLEKAKRLRGICFIGAFYLGLIACGIRNGPLSCSDAVELTLYAIPFDELSASNLVQWVQDTYKLDSSDVVTNEYVKGGQNLVWRDQSNLYNAHLPLNDLLRLDVYWQRAQPSAQVIMDPNCLNEPDLYRASYAQDVEAKLFTLELWYLDEGMVITHHSFSQNEQPPAVGGKLPMSSVSVLRVQGAAEMVEDMFGVETGFTDEDRQQILQELKPWPGAWDLLEITTPLRSDR